MSESSRRLTMALISIGLLVGACSRTGADSTPSPSASPVPTAVVASAIPAASPEPSPSSEPVLSPSAPDESPLPEPPAGLLAVEGGEAVKGQLGSFTWKNGGSDAPWLDGTPIHVGAGERLAVTFGEPIGVSNWTASRVPPGNRDGFGAIGIGEGLAGPIAFDPPPKGSWSVSVEVWFENFGSAAYYWLVNVE
jgi:hypothetical protein